LGEVAEIFAEKVVKLGELRRGHLGGGDAGGLAFERGLAAVGGQDFAGRLGVEAGDELAAEVFFGGEDAESGARPFTDFGGGWRRRSSGGRRSCRWRRCSSG